MIKFDLKLFESIASDIFNCDSPTGYTDKVIKLIEEYVKEKGRCFTDP